MPAKPMNLHWVARGETLLLTGPTGVGKTWLACALAHHACQRGYPALYLRVPCLADELTLLLGRRTAPGCAFRCK